MRIWKCLHAKGFLLVISLTLVGYGFGCSRSCRIESYEADDGTMIDRMIGNKIGDDIAMGGNSYFYLDAQRCQDRKGSITYSLVLTTHWSYARTGRDFWDMSPKKVLTLDIDGESVRLSPSGEARREEDQSNREFTETSFYPISPDILSKLANAHEVEVNPGNLGTTGALFGAYRTYGVLEAHNIADFKRFYEKYGNRTEQSAAQRQ